MRAAPAGRRGRRRGQEILATGQRKRASAILPRVARWRVATARAAIPSRGTCWRRSRTSDRGGGLPPRRRWFERGSVPGEL